MIQIDIRNKLKSQGPSWYVYSTVYEAVLENLAKVTNTKSFGIIVVYLFCVMKTKIFTVLL